MLTTLPTWQQTVPIRENAIVPWHGAISARDGVLAATVMIIGAFLATIILLPIGCTVVLASYLVITLLYRRGSSDCR